ncbi:MAG TPA: fibronectin type III domain-containing protein [Gemmatimonadaceae bacterium]
MFVSNTRLSRPRFLFSLLAGLLGFVLSCQDSRNSVLGPDHRGLLPPAAPHEAVIVGQYVHMYVQAFVDDWPLFMGDRVPASLSATSEVVFVFTSSGDKNLGMPYVTTRESGGEAAIDSVLQRSGSWTCGNATVQTHPILRCTKGPAVAYFMRLPDGGPAGDGYGTRGSMALLRDGGVASLTTIDGSTTYTSWADLMATVRGIVDLEGAGQGAPYVQINTFDFDRTINPSDHPDRAATADLMNAASGSRSWNVNWFVGAHAQTLAVDLSQTAHDVKQEAFYGYDAVVGGAGYGHPKYDTDAQLLFWRTYFRTTTSVPVPPPAAPTALHGTAFSSTRTDLGWTNNATNAIGIDVESAPDVGGTAGTYTLVATVGPTTTSYSVTNQQPTTAYWYRVRARNATDVSAYSNSVTVTTLTPPPAPTALHAQAVNSSRIDLSWTDNATGETSVSVERAPDNAGVPGTYAVIATLAAGTTSYSSVGLTGSTRYWYRVRVFVASDVSPYSSAVAATTPVAPVAPTGLTATAVSASRINLSWTDPGGETSFTLQRAPDVSGTPGTFATIASPVAGTTAYSDQTGLISGTRYWYQIRSNTATDASPFTPAVSATTQATPPAAPSGLVASAVSSSRIDLTWVDGSNNETGFSVERAADNAGTPGPFTVLITLPANTTSYSNTGLLATTRYWYRVRATNSAGSSPYTANASATTLAPPAVVTHFYIHAHQDDWQLFMGERANTSLQTATKVVFVYTSAGDANLGTAYWTLRETASMNAVDALLPGTGWTCGSQTVNAHPLRRCARGIAVAYYMRLPDGATSGEGFGGRGSMPLLRDGGIATLTAMDGSTHYNTWADLTNTVGAIVDLESSNASAPAVEVNAPEYDRVANAGDHPDHLATADLVQAASLSRSWNLNWYVGYRAQFLTVNLTQAQHDIKMSAFYGYDNTMGHGGYGFSQYEAPYQAWLWRDYSRSIIH